jgi:hypothetical protein
MKKHTIFLALIGLIALSYQCYASLDLVGPLNDDRHVQSGKKYSGVILMRNTGDKPLKVQVTQHDYTFTYQGRNFYDVPGTNKRSNARWISLSSNKVIIPPLSDMSLGFNVKVPKKKDLAGTYWSIVMLTPDEDNSSSVAGSSESVTIKSVFAFGYQVVTTVGNLGSASIKFVDKTIVSSEGKTLLKVSLKNDGEMLVIPEVWASIFAESGENLGRFDAMKARIFPGCSLTSDIDMSRVPDGKYKALIVVDTGQADPVGAQYDIVIKR